MEEDKRYLVIGQREHSIEIWGGIGTKIINSIHPPSHLHGNSKHFSSKIGTTLFLSYKPKASLKFQA